MKRISFIAKLLLIAIACLTAIYDASAKGFSLSFPETEIVLKPGESANLSLLMENSDAKPFRGFQTSVTLPTGLSLTSAGVGQALKNTSFTVEKSTGIGTSYIVMLMDISSTTGTSIASGEILNIQITADTDAKPLNDKIVLSENVFTSAGGADIPVENDATINIEIFVPVTQISLTTRSNSIFVDESTEVTATLTPNIPTNSEIEWSLSSTGIAEIASQSGLSATIHGLKPGEATVIATAKGGTDVYSTLTIEVKPIPASSVKISKQELTMLAGTSYLLMASAEPDNTTYPEITWSSDNESVASVAASGRVIAKAEGTAVITATCGEAKAICNLSVAEIESITSNPEEGMTDGSNETNPGIGTAEGGMLTGNDITLRVGQTASLSISILPETEYNPGVKWTLANEGDNIVSMTTDADNSLAATFTGCSIGETSYSISMPESGKIILSGTISVIAENPILSISVEPETLSMTKNALPVTLNAIIEPSDATISKVVWSSDNEAVATVSEDGTVSPIGEGRCIITATTTDGTKLKSSCSVNVNEESHIAIVDDNDDSWITMTENGVHIELTPERATLITVHTLDGALIYMKQFPAGLPISENITNKDIAANPYLITIASGNKSVSKKVYISL